MTDLIDDPKNRPSPDESSLSATRPTRRFADYVAVLARWRTPIYLTVLVVGAIGAAYLWFLVPNVYESRAQIKSSVVTQVNASGLGSMLNVKGVGDLGGILGMASQRSDLDQYIGVLESRLVLNDIVTRFDLQRQYDAKYIEDAIKTLKENVKFTSDRESQLLTIAIQDTNPRRAQQMCERLIELLDSVNKSLSRRNAQSAREYLELRYRQCIRQLAESEDSLRVFQMRYRVYDMKDQATASIKVAAELEGEIAIKEVQAHLVAQALGAEDADAKRLASEVEELKRKRHQMDAGLDASGAFQSIIPFGDAPRMGMEYFRRFRDVEIQQRLFALLFPMYEQAKVDEQRNSPTLLVLDAPSLANRKVKPMRSIITLGLMFAAFIVMFLFALVIEDFRSYQQRRPAEYQKMRDSMRVLLPRFLTKWM